MGIKTYQQGELDGLCGAYAVHNAIRRLMDTRSCAEWDDGLFKVILRSIPKGAYPDVLWKGTNIEQLFRVAKRTTKDLLDRYGWGISAERPFEDRTFQTAKAYLAALDRRLEGDLATAVVGINWKGVESGHWSVFRSLDGEGLRLYDSGGVRRLNLAQLSTKDVQRRHQLCPEETIVFRWVSIEGEPV